MTLLKRLQNRIIYHTILKGVEFLNRKKDYINPGETILVFSNPRGGSTWMAEILNEIPKSVVVWEPLFKTKLKGFSNLDFHWHQPIPAGTIWPEARAEFKKLLNRENLALSLYFKNNL